jgi:hypothetical protein
MHLMPSAAPAFLRPGPGEHHEYYGLYVSQVSDGDVLDTLERQVEETTALLRSVPAARETYRYADGKWSIREVIGHVLDTERVFGLRALHFARRDPAPLPSFEQDDWARVSNAHARPLADLVEEFRAVRRGHVLLLRGLDPDAGPRRGVASGREFTVRSIPWILAGHERHHVGVLRERYLEL